MAKMLLSGSKISKAKGKNIFLIIFEARPCLDRPGTHSYSPASDSQVLDL